MTDAGANWDQKLAAVLALLTDSQKEEFRDSGYDPDYARDVLGQRLKKLDIDRRDFQARLEEWH
jgi:hypothetical protein